MVCCRRGTPWRQKDTKRWFGLFLKVFNAGLMIAPPRYIARSCRQFLGIIPCSPTEKTSTQIPQRPTDKKNRNRTKEKTPNWPSFPSLDLSYRGVPQRGDGGLCEPWIHQVPSDHCVAGSRYLGYSVTASVSVSHPHFPRHDAEPTKCSLPVRPLKKVRR